MKLIVLLFFFLLTDYVHSACSTPVSRGGTFSSGTTISSSAMNTQLNTLYTHVNDIDGDCIQDTSLNKSKLEAGYKDATITSVSGAYTALSTDEVILASAGSAFTITLPTAVGITGRTYTIKKTDASVNAITLDANSAETIDGALNYILSGQFNTVSIVSNGSVWQVLDDKAQIAILSGRKSSGTDAGTFTSGSWVTRELTSEDSDINGIVVLTANQFTLGVGSYLIEASAPASYCNGHQTKLRNITDSTDDLIGSSAYATASGTADSSNRSFINGIITITSSKVFELQHKAQTTRAGNGLGAIAGSGVSEVYAVVKITKLD